MKKLRPYQEKAIQECWQALAANDKPVLLMASVGAGKSVIIAEMLLKLQRAGRRALCLVSNSELVRNNADTFRAQGGNASVYCSALGEKDDTAPVVFASPQSVLNAVVRGRSLADIPFSMIVVDEAHLINYQKPTSTFMRVLRHYKQYNPTMRLLGATGTPYRFKDEEIVGERCLFKTQVGNITTEYLIDNGYLVKPRFEINRDLVIDFSNIKSKFTDKQLQAAVDKKPRLTELICKQIIHIMESENRFGCILFASTKKHAHEIMSHLPANQSALVLGEMPADERTRIYNAARAGELRYLVNISIISTGVDLPAFCTAAYLRPTESLVLLVQTMGRVLRLSPETNKKEALVLDFAGNILRHQDIDNPILMEAIEQTEADDEGVFECPTCKFMNTAWARRCRGKVSGKRCEYFFVFKECGECEAQNDMTARNCRKCDAELIDPNKKLNLTPPNMSETTKVHACKYWLGQTEIGAPIFYAVYETDLGTQYERFILSSPQSFRYFYGTFLKALLPESSTFSAKLGNSKTLAEIVRKCVCPTHLVLSGKQIKKRIAPTGSVE